MSNQYETSFLKEYDGSFKIAYQQLDRKLAFAMRQESQNAEVKFWDFIGKTSAQRDVARGSKTPRMNTPHSRRSCKMHSYTWADTISDLDVIQSLKDPQSAYMQVGVGALHRGEDEDALAAMYADVLTEKEGNTTVHCYDAGECRLIEGDGSVLAAGSNFAGTTATYLTVPKLQTISRLMDNAGVPKEGRYLTANATNKQALQASTECKNIQYNNSKTLVDDSLDYFMGFNFIWMEDDRFTVNTTDTECIQCAAWQRDAMLQTTGMDIKTEVSKLDDENYDTQVWARSFKGNLRLQGPGVVLILLKKD